MRLLHHFPLCPFSRMIRVLLTEKELPYELKIEPFWERNETFARLNPAMEVPVLVEQGPRVICDINAILEYLEEVYGARSFLGESMTARIEVRRIVGWFNRKFYHEVTHYILHERVIRYYLQGGETNSAAIRAAKVNIHYHLEYIAFLLKKRPWLAGDKLSMADIAAACQLSVLDYLGDIPWEQYSAAKEWYAIMKSRPSFRSLLLDRISGFVPAKHYMNPDF